MFVSMSGFNLEQRRKDIDSYYKSLNNLRRRTGISQVSEGDIESVELADTFSSSSVATETTPLLVGETAATTAGGSILSSIPVTGATLAGGLTAAGIIGGVFSSLTNNNEKNHQSPIITLPDHNYLGPGNSINTGEKPIDKDDLGAFNHDLDYNKAKNSEDIREADREHILNTLEDIQRGDIHSIISGAGIATKYGIESITGVKYPITG